ncbi:PDR/VanB family oxidoreductase [Agromyces sp. Leaf222]|uniref:PDR/VanB family oxidoreductase n=1 Tax=Agromyces sp. Leaf222 TaxID=1735688 RepID=UPI0006FA32F1|nr:PDR/VanB family oxidoreductase [Agromyces sp. Leaf222]KQM83562.1 ferredoxin [Agromyces sp. Leaf222]
MTLIETGDDVLVVAAKTKVADGVVSLVLQRRDGGRLPDWTPGAHLDLVLPDGTTRQYSLHGDPREASIYRIAVLREAGGSGGSRYVHDELREGDAVGFGGPRNNFRLTPAPAFAFVAGGIGITPLLPMLRAATLLGSDWRLLYIGRSRARMAFLDELARYGERVTIRASDEHGPTDIRSWLETGPDAAAMPQTKVYACGPARLTEAVSQLAAERRPGWTRVERFAAADRGEPARTTPFEVEVAGSGRSIRVAPGVAVADALRSAGFDLLTSCSRGVCGTCETSIVAGVPDHRDSILDDAERADGTCFFPCVSRAKSDRLVISL